MRPSRRRQALLLVHLVTRAASSAAAQDGPPRTEYALGAWTTAHGLPQNTVLGVAQDRDGYLWVATPGDLVRFDGHRFRSAGLPVVHDGRPDPIRSVVTAPDGRVWVLQSRAGAGVVRDDGRVERRTDSLPAGPSEFAVARGDSIWVRRGAGVWLHADGRWREVMRGVAGSLRTMLVDASGVVWVGGTRGLARLEGGRVRSWRSSDGLPQDTVLALAQDARGDILALTSGGLAELSAAGHGRPKAVLGIPDSGLSAIAVAAGGRVWLGSLGLVRLIAIRHVPGAEPRAETLSLQATETGDARLRALQLDRG